MRALILATLAATACSTDRCKSGTVYVSYALTNGAEAADTIDVTLAIGSGAPRTMPVSRKTHAASGSIEVDFAAAYPSGQSLTLTLTARLGNQPLASSSQTTPATAGCTTLSFTLDGTHTDLGVADLGVDALTPDLATSPDLAPRVPWFSASSGLPSGMAVSTLAIDPLAPTTVYAGGVTLYKSIDGAASWSATGLTASIGVHAVVIDPSATGTLYVATDGSGIYKSTNGGTSWAPASMGAPNYVYSLAIDPKNSLNIFAGTDVGLYNTTSGGGGWYADGFGLPTPSNGLYVLGIAFDPINSTNIYLATSNGMFKSTDGGNSWKAANMGLPASAPLNAVVLDRATAGILYCGTMSGVVYKTTTSAADWFLSNTGITATAINGLAIDPSAPGILYAASSKGAYKSTDSGGSWSGINGGLSTMNVMGFVIDPTSPLIIFAATDKGVFKTLSGGQ